LQHNKRKIPPRIVQNAVGLAIFSCMRSGLWKSGSGGSGILVARKSDGRWSPPSAFLLHTAALGFVIGVDVYDCVLVINSMSDLEMFTRPQTTLGADVQLAVGPTITEGRIENEVRGKDPGHTVLTYVRARGEHRAVNIDGSSVTERGSENQRFYGSDVSVLDVLAGQVPDKDVPEIRTLYEVLKCAEGRVDFNAPLLEKLALQPAPGDAVIEDPAALSLISPGRPAFGVPDNEDPDPFGVRALEMAGLEIREAGTRHRPASSQFEYSPSPNSPLFGQYNNRQSTDTYITQSNRGSYMSNRTTFSRMTDAFTQTTVDTRGTTPTSDEGVDRASIDKLPVVMEPDEIEHSQETAVRSPSGERPESIPEDRVAEEKAANEITTISEEGPAEINTEKADKVSIDERDEDADDEQEGSDVESDREMENQDHDISEDDDDDDDDDDDEPIVFELATAAQPVRAVPSSTQVTQIIHAKGALVNIPKRVIPAIPPRSPARSSRFSKSDFGDIPAKSPLRNSFQSTMTSQSDEGAEHRTMDGVIESSTKWATNVTPASPCEQDVETQMQQLRSRASSPTYTTVMEKHLSMETEDMPRTPSTLHTSGPTSSGDEQEPRTPKAENEAATTRGAKVAKHEVMSFGVELDASY
jgi:lipid-binding SYLF domain-containing protein